MLSITELRGKNLSMFLCGGSDIIPMKFHKYSAVRDYQFRICNSGFYRNLHDMPGWPCTIYKDTHWEEVYLPLSEFPHEIEALSILSTLDDETEREGRYINVHAAYEAVVLIRETDYSAIRHLLAHPVVRLTRPNVRESLE